MMLFFVIVLVLAVGLLQHRMAANSLESVREEYYPDGAVVEIGEEFHLVIRLENAGRRYLPFVRVQMDLPWVQDLNAKVMTVKRSTWLKPHEQIEFKIPLSVSARGRYVMPGLEISCGDFLGLKEKKRTLERFHEIVVPPRETGILEIETVLGGFLGDRSVSRFLYEDPVLTAGYREYTGREPMKMISWKQSSRGQGLVVKTCDHTVEPMVSVLLNTDGRKRKNTELLEVCFSLARTVCGILEEKGISYDFSMNAMMAGLSTEPDELREGLGSRHFSRILECLGRATGEVTSSWPVFLERAAGKGMMRARILITVDDEAENTPVLARLREASGGNLLVLQASCWMGSREAEVER